jgi:endonuclease YncB( thermonuclease family)
MVTAARRIERNVHPDFAMGLRFASMVAGGRRLAAGVAGLVLAGTPTAAAAGEILPGPVPAQVVSVIDGDTLVVRARIWLGLELETRVRISGIDTPELRGGCVRERALAERARRLVVEIVAGREVVLREVRLGKYAGRVVARVATDDGRDLGSILLSAGLARTYDGGPRGDWCPTESAPG